MVSSKSKSKDEKNGEKMKARLITMNLMGSCGAIRFFVSENQSVSSVAETALKNFAREGRLPVLGSKSDQFVLYSLDDSGMWQALDPSETVGSDDHRRNFRLCKKPLAAAPNSNCAALTLSVTTRSKPAFHFKSWIRKSLHLHVSSH